MSAAAYILPLVFTLFVWWFTTGLIISAYGRSPQFIARFFAAASGVALSALAGVWLLRGGGSLLAAYGAIVCGITLWGWQTASYYFGFVKGPARQQETSIPHNSAERFWAALQDSLYHELTALFTAILLAAITWNAPNRWALAIYCALWLLHSSAKLNVFLGVRNFRLEFLPDHLHHLSGLLGKQSSNWLLPFSLLISLGAATNLFLQAAASTSEAQIAGLMSIGVMVLLGAFEHVLLVVPLSFVQWGWGMRELPPQPNTVTVAEKNERNAPLRMPLGTLSEVTGD